MANLWGTPIERNRKEWYQIVRCEKCKKERRIGYSSVNVGRCRACANRERAYNKRFAKWNEIREQERLKGS